jgi:hypothetical protein
MAKVISSIELKGTHGNTTYVRSKQYGNHVRAKRGTYKKAVLNDAFKKQAKAIGKISAVAKIIKGALDPYRQDLRDSKLWPRLIAAMHKLGKSGTFDLSKMEPLEVNDNYRVDRFFTLTTTTAVDKAHALLRVTFAVDGRPIFKEKAVDAYRMGVIAIYPNQKKKSAETRDVYSDAMKFIAKPAPVVLEVPVPRGAKDYIVCVKVEGCQKGKVYFSYESKGMRIVDAGKVG